MFRFKPEQPEQPEHRRFERPLTRPFPRTRMGVNLKAPVKLGGILKGRRLDRL